MKVLLCTVALATAAPAVAAAEGLSEITREDFHGALYYKNALEHPTVAKLPSEERKLRAVARDMGWPMARLKSAVDKVAALGEDPVQVAQDAIMKGFEGTRLEGQVLQVLINADNPDHAVAYVRWRGSHKVDVVKEAATIAHVVHKQAPFIATASIAAIHPKSPPDSKMTVWSAKIGDSQMARIQPSRIEDYADRLYARMFENVQEKAIPY